MRFIFFLSFVPGIALAQVSTPDQYARNAGDDACSDGASPATVLASVLADQSLWRGYKTREADFTGCPADVSEESCICGALRLGWKETARSILTARMVRKEQSPALRRFAQRRQDGAVALLARMHQRYPNHLKIIPAIEWAQTDELVFIRIRYARYTRGEPLCLRADAFEFLFDDDGVKLTVEGDEKPLYIDTSLKWRHPFRRRDGCADDEADAQSCKLWLAEGLCNGSMREELLGRCRRSCGACPAANGSLAIDAVWAHVPGGLRMEARKLRKGQTWDRLLDAAQPPNRIAPADGSVRVGELMGCVEACAKASGCGSRHGITTKDHRWSSYFFGDDPESGEGKEEEAMAAKCYEPIAEPCRQQCEETVAGRYAVR